MSHKLFRHSMLSNGRVWAFLKQVDAAEAEACRAAGCPRCGGELQGLPGSALSEESRDARTPLYRDSGGLQFASAVVPGPRKKGDNPNR